MDKEVKMLMKQKGFDNVNVSYNIVDRSVTIYSGTKISDEEYSARFKEIRKRLINDGYIVDNCFAKDYLVERKKSSEFNTALSTAAGIILGRNAAGPKEFYVLQDGQEVFMYKFLLELYIDDHINDESDISLSAQKDLIQEFKNEFPFEEFSNLSYKNYASIKEVSDKSLSYLLEYGKYKDLCYTSIRGGELDKYGFYQQKKNNSIDYYYFGDKLEDEESINEKWIKFRDSIVRVLKIIKEKDMVAIENILNDENIDANIEKVSTIIFKLASIYFPNNIIQISSKNCIRILYDLLIDENENYNIFYKSMKIREYLSEKYPSVDPIKLSKILYEYYLEKYPNNKLENRKCWVIASGEKSRLWDEFKNGNFIAIGWNELGNLSLFKSKEEIKNKYIEVYGKNGDNDVCALWAFYHQMSKGDIVFVKDGLSKIIGYGEVSGDYYFDETFEYNHKRAVIWKSFDVKELADRLNMAVKTLTELKKKYELRDYLIDVYEDQVQLEREIDSDLDEYIGKNTIFYGVPGSGKSRKVSDLLESVEDECFKRVLFHPEYSYSDFIGQVMPTVKDDKITYDFVPGPFTEILKDAIKSQNEGDETNYYLVIEEINRGNAPAIFGDVFQLLDRKLGKSEYEINNREMAKFIFKDESKKIYIPSNLTIFATMNTCDQNVFIMDTAFKRRWRMNRIENDFENAEFSNITIDGLPFTWGEFATKINDLILNLNDGFNSEDKQLGAYFVKKEEIQDIQLFAEKVLMYLWEDVVKYDKSQLFNANYKTLDSLIKGFVKGENVFASGMDELYNRNNIAETENVGQ